MNAIDIIVITFFIMWGPFLFFVSKRRKKLHKYLDKFYTQGELEKNDYEYYKENYKIGFNNIQFDIFSLPKLKEFKNREYDVFYSNSNRIMRSYIWFFVSTLIIIFSYLIITDFVLK